MTEYRKDDVCSLEVVVTAAPADAAIGVKTKGGTTFAVLPSDLTLVRRAPVDLATCEIGDGIAVRHREYAAYDGIMLSRVKHGDKLFAFVDWDSGEPGVCLVSDIEPLRPLDAPAPDKSEVERLRDVEQRKFYRSDWTIKQLLEARNGGLITDDGEAWRYQFSHKDAKGEYDMLYRPVTAPTCPPSHIMIGDRAVPEPMREAPEYGAKFWVPSLTQESMAIWFCWIGSSFGKRLLALGLIHSTEANARAHAEAIIAMSERGDA